VNKSEVSVSVHSEDLTACAEAWNEVHEIKKMLVETSNEYDVGDGAKIEYPADMVYQAIGKLELVKGLLDPLVEKAFMSKLVEFHYPERKLEWWEVFKA
jgi:hypothetical protein